MIITPETRIAPSGDFGRVIVSETYSTKEMSLQEFCHHFNHNQRVGSQASPETPSPLGRAGVGSLDSVTLKES